MNNELYAFYMNIDTQDRVSVVWNVCLTMPACVYGHVEVTATTSEEAAQLALGKHLTDVEWDYDCYACDDGAASVVLVECKHPPADAALIRPGRKTGANLDAFFEPDDQPTAKREQSQSKAEADGGDLCK